MEDYNLRYDDLDRRLMDVKREAGFRRALSNKNLTGDTRTFAEILDQEVEKIVLYYLRVQGMLAEKSWELREEQIAFLHDFNSISVDGIDRLCEKFRDLGHLVMDLLSYLEFNVTGVRMIIRQYDSVYDQKLGSMYFDSRVGKGSKHSQLTQLYHQEGLRAIIGTLRRGFEDLYDARNALTNPFYDTEMAYNDRYAQSSNSLISSYYYRPVPRMTYKARIASFASMGNLRALVDDMQLDEEKGSLSNTAGAAGAAGLPIECVPAVNESTALLGSSIASTAAQREGGIGGDRGGGSFQRGGAAATGIGGRRGVGHISTGMLNVIGQGTGGSLALNLSAQGTRRRSSRSSRSGSISGWVGDIGRNFLSLGELKNTARFYDPSTGIERSLSDLEPILLRLDNASKRVMHSQNASITKYVAEHSDVALEVSVRDLLKHTNAEEADAYQERKEREENRTEAQEWTMRLGLHINLFITFTYMTNLYVVAPTSGEYANMLGMSPSMSGLIIGLAPTSTLLSAFVYSMWTNYSFINPLVTCVVCGIVGNLFYAIALQCGSPALLFMGRLLSGLGSPRGICRRYIADHVSFKDRTIASTQFITAGAMGLACGPLISAFAEHSQFSFQWRLPSSVFGVGSGSNSGFQESRGGGGGAAGEEGLMLVWYRDVTAPGWLMFLMWSVMLITVIFFFKDPLLDTAYTQAGQNIPATDSREKNHRGSGRVGSGGRGREGGGAPQSRFSFYNPSSSSQSLRYSTGSAGRGDSGIYGSIIASEVSIPDTAILPSGPTSSRVTAASSSPPTLSSGHTSSASSLTLFSGPATGRGLHTGSQYLEGRDLSVNRSGIGAVRGSDESFTNTDGSRTGTPLYADTKNLPSFCSLNECTMEDIREAESLGLSVVPAPSVASSALGRPDSVRSSSSSTSPGPTGGISLRNAQSSLISGKPSGSESFSNSSSSRNMLIGEGLLVSDSFKRKAQALSSSTLSYSASGTELNLLGGVSEPHNAVAVAGAVKSDAVTELVRDEAEEGAQSEESEDEEDGTEQGDGAAGRVNAAELASGLLTTAGGDFALAALATAAAAASAISTVFIGSSSSATSSSAGGERAADMEVLDNSSKAENIAEYGKYEEDDGSLDGELGTGSVAATQNNNSNSANINNNCNSNMVDNIGAHKKDARLFNLKGTTNHSLDGVTATSVGLALSSSESKDIPVGTGQTEPGIDVVGELGCGVDSRSGGVGLNGSSNYDRSKTSRRRQETTAITNGVSSQAKTDSEGGLSLIPQSILKKEQSSSLRAHSEMAAIEETIPLRGAVLESPTTLFPPRMLTPPSSIRASTDDASGFGSGNNNSDRMQSGRPNSGEIRNNVSLSLENATINMGGRDSTGSGTPNMLFEPINDKKPSSLSSSSSSSSYSVITRRGLEGAGNRNTPVSTDFSLLPGTSSAGASLKGGTGCGDAGSVGLSTEQARLLNKQKRDSTANSQYRFLFDTRSSVHGDLNKIVGRAEERGRVSTSSRDGGNGRSMGREENSSDRYSSQDGKKRRSGRKGGGKAAGNAGRAPLQESSGDSGSYRGGRSAEAASTDNIALPSVAMSSNRGGYGSASSSWESGRGHGIDSFGGDVVGGEENLKDPDTQADDRAAAAAARAVVYYGYHNPSPGGSAGAFNARGNGNRDRGGGVFSTVGEQLYDDSSHCFYHITIEVYIVLLLYTVNKAGQEITVSATPLATSRAFNWSSETCGFYMAILGAMVLPANILIGKLLTEMEDRDIVRRILIFSMMSSSLLLDVNSFFHIEYSEFQYVLGSALLFVSLNTMEGIIMSLLSKLVSPELARGTFNSGLMATEAGTFGRVLGDMAITALAQTSSGGGTGIESLPLVNKLYLPIIFALLFSTLIVTWYFDNFRV